MEVTLESGAFITQNTQNKTSRLPKSCAVVTSPFKDRC